MPITIEDLTKANRLMLCDDHGETAYVAPEIFFSAQSARDDADYFICEEPDCAPWAVKYVADLGEYCPAFPHGM